MTTTRHALAADVTEVTDVLAKAFHDDPVWSWAMPDADVRRSHLPSLFDVFAAAGLRHGHLYCAPGAAAVWSPPDVAAFDDASIAAFVDRLAPAVGERLHTVLAGLASIGEHHPEVPHFYLGLIGTEPDQRGQGLAGQLLRRVLDVCDRERLPSYLESSNPANVGLYERYGYVVTGQVKMPDGGPSLDLMWREPGAG